MEARGNCDDVDPRQAAALDEPVRHVAAVGDFAVVRGSEQAEKLRQTLPSGVVERDSVGGSSRVLPTSEFGDDARRAGREAMAAREMARVESLKRGKIFARNVLSATISILFRPVQRRRSGGPNCVGRCPRSGDLRRWFGLFILHSSHARASAIGM